MLPDIPHTLTSDSFFFHRSSLKTFIHRPSPISFIFIHPLYCTVFVIPDIPHPFCLSPLNIFSFHRPLKTVYLIKQCCGSGMIIPDPNFFHPGSQIRIRKNFFVTSRKYDPGCWVLIYYPPRIPDPGVKKAQDPGSASKNLIF
jgi:hypothetical protein